MLVRSNHESSTARYFKVLHRKEFNSTEAPSFFYGHELTHEHKLTRRQLLASKRKDVDGS